jgi:hypothetical protein
MVGINSVPKLPLQHHLKATFTGLITHFSKSMSTTLPATISKAPRANWNDAEITALIDYLIEHIAEVGDGGNFKKAMFTKALRAVGPHHCAGPQKTASMCNLKYQSVSWVYPMMCFLGHEAWCEHQ